MALTLVSFKLCPFVQRSIIVLKEKQVEFDIRYIDLRNKPQWFLDISPTGKVPVLQVDDQVLFESSAINEYLDEEFSPQLHPADSLTRARNRAWIEMANQLSSSQFGFTMAKEEPSYRQNIDKTHAVLQQLERQMGEGPFFNGPEFALIDAAYAPFFTRQAMVDNWFSTEIVSGYPKVKNYGEQLKNRPSVVDSVVPDYDKIYHQRLEDEQTWLYQNGSG